MKFTYRVAALLCCLLLLLPLNARAEETEDPQDLIQQMLCYYYHYQSGGKTDIYRLLEQLETIDPDKADLWKSIFDYWMYAAEESPKNETTLPDDLPQDDSLCIVVLGYCLNSDGGMLPELIGRLELARDAANQYPNARIVCTGGGTASQKPNVTEAGQMARWLRNQGIESDRIIVENRSRHTIENARYVLQILSKDNTQVRQVVLVTSDYHITRSSTLFHAAMEHTAHENGTEPITIVACLGYEAGHEGVAEDILDQTAHVARLSGFEYNRASQPELSILTGITISGETLLDADVPLALTVTAHYDSGYTRDVTADSTFSPFDPTITQTQQVQITYQENGILLTETVLVQRPAPETEPPTLPPTEPPATEAVVLPEEPAQPFPWQYLLPAIPVVGIIALIVLKKKK